MSENITAYFSVFEEKLTKLKVKLKKELKIAKHKRDKKLIKLLLKEAKCLRNVLQGSKNVICCPKCGCHISADIV